MGTMSLFETGDSSGDVSIENMKNDIFNDMLVEKVEFERLAYYIIRGGWPSNINVSVDKADIIPLSYIQAILDKDIHDDKSRDKSKMRMLLKSLARNESSLASKVTLLKDINECDISDVKLESRTTMDDYLDILERLHVINNQLPYTENYRSKDKIGKSAKRHFIDPSLACSSLELNVNKLMNDFRTFGLMFEALVEHDLKIYMDYLSGNLFHFRDNVTGLEVDSILEFKDGEYAAVEIKLSLKQLSDAKENLLNFKKNMNKKPKFMCIIVGHTDIIAKDKETGIYIIPFTALRP